MELNKINAVTEQIIGAAYRVHNALRSGFAEKVYENALAHELRKLGLDVKQQHPITVFYDGVVVGEYVADLLIADTVLVELKAIKALDDIHQAQCVNYLAATGLTVCLLLNFGRSVVVKRFANNIPECCSENLC